MKDSILLLLGPHAWLFSISCFPLLLFGVAVSRAQAQQPTRDIEVTDIEQGQTNAHVIRVPSTVSPEILPLLAAPLPEWNVHPQSEDDG